LFLLGGEMVARVKMACFGLGVNAVVRLRRLGARKIENKLYMITFPRI
jgi:hypothetical protein